MGPLKAYPLVIILSWAITTQASTFDMLPPYQKLLETKCQSFESFFLHIKKDVVESSYNPFAAWLALYTTENKFGVIRTREVLKAFDQLSLDLGISEPDRDVDLAKELAEQFKEVPYCLQVSDAATLVFKLLKYNFVKDHANFLKTFLYSVSPKFALQFILYVLNSILECDKDLTGSLIKSYYDSGKSIIDEFVRLYKTVIELHKEKTSDLWMRLFEKTFNKTIMEGRALVGVFLLYQLKNILISNADPTLNWYIENFLLVKIGTFLTVLTNDLKRPKPEAYIENLKDFFSQLTDKPSLKTKNVLRIEEEFLHQGQFVEDCPQCKARRAVEKAKQYNKYLA